MPTTTETQVPQPIVVNVPVLLDGEISNSNVEQYTDNIAVMKLEMSYMFYISKAIQNLAVNEKHYIVQKTNSIVDPDTSLSFNFSAEGPDLFKINNPRTRFFDAIAPIVNLFKASKANKCAIRYDFKPQQSGDRFYLAQLIKSPQCINFEVKYLVLDNAYSWMQPEETLHGITSI
jgi:hypothetical protein